MPATKKAETHRAKAALKVHVSSPLEADGSLRESPTEQRAAWVPRPQTSPTAADFARASAVYSRATDQMRDIDAEIDEIHRTRAAMIRGVCEFPSNGSSDTGYASDASDEEARLSASAEAAESQLRLLAHARAMCVGAQKIALRVTLGHAPAERLNCEEVRRVCGPDQVSALA